jgi:putative DNA primase/helicase
MDKQERARILFNSPAGQKAFTEEMKQEKTRPLTDLGNAERLVDQHGQDIRYCGARGQWIIWDGQRWLPDGTGHVYHLAKRTVRAIALEANAVEEGTEFKRLVKWAEKSESESRLNAMVNIARTEKEVAVSPGDFDRYPYLLNVANGTVDLYTGELRPHRREDLHTRLAPVEYRPQASCPQWLAFLARITRQDEDLIGFLQRAVGYSLTGDTSEQCLFLLHGSGANGKSTFIEVLRALLGDYARQADASTFLHKDQDTVRNDLARLAGVRFVSAVEAAAGRRLAEVLVKQITGGDTITARFLYHEHFEFDPTFKVWLAANHKPEIRGTDYAIWRRIHLIPFTVTIPKEEQDKRLLQKLKAELPGILNWALQGCQEWQREGLCEPGKVQEATKEYREEMDPLGSFLNDCCTLSPGVQAPAADLYRAYTKWCQANGEDPLTQHVFGRLLRDRGLTKDRSSVTGRTVWKGISLRSLL